MTEHNTIDETGKRSDAGQNIDIQILSDFLRKQAGEVSYEAMSDILGRDVRNGAWAVLAGARRVLLREGIVFGTIRGVGIKCLTDEEIVGTGHAAIRKTRRATRRAINTLACADYDKLTNEARIKHNTYASLLGALNAVTKEPQVRKIEASVKSAQAKLPLAKTLDVFKT